MHYYQKNIGDYRRDTMHLSPLEHGIYNLFLDTYYLTEKPLCADHAELMRTHCLRTAYEISAAENVLKDFFDLCENGYSHKRCDIEIELFHGKSNSARESAKARWERVRCERNANALNSHSEGNANHKPITINHEPITNNHKPTTNIKSKDLSAPKKGTALSADWFLPKEWGEWALSEKPNWTVDDVRRVADDFKDHWLANANQAKSKKADWYATWRKWVRSPLNEIKSKNGIAAKSKPWFLTASGIESKAKEINFDTNDEPVGVYRLRICKQLGITEEMIRSANQDFLT